MEYTHVKHPFEPVCDRDSEILILGSLPSVKSRENNFYYGHKQNRFWKVISGIYGEAEPQSIYDKRKMLLKNHVAIWDVIRECDIHGSSDSSIKNVIATDLGSLMHNTGIKRIYANGNKAGALYKKYQQKLTGMDITILPSTSPANAAWSLEKLIAAWQVINGR